tara:strand:- start:94730 stop:95959 length:1230 start_codon:yes stop_codon:yes gene_type:complete
MIIMGAFVGMRYVLEVSSNHKDLAIRADNIATRISNAVQPTIWNIYSKSTHRAYSEDLTSAIVDSEFLDPYVIGVSVYGNFGHVFMARYRDENGTIVNHAPSIHKASLLRADQRSLMSVKQGEMTIGNVLVLLSSAPNRANIRKLLVVELIQILSISIIFVLFLFYAIRMALLKPAAELAAANAELEEFTYRTSHDLRAPLISAIKLSDMAIDAYKSDKKEMAMNCMQHIKTSLVKLEALTTDILSLTQTQKQQEEKQEIKFDALIQDAIEKLQYMDNVERLNITVDIQSNPKIMLKKSRIQLIVENLISNAIKYQDLNAEQSFITISTYTEGKNIIFEVTDNGLGIPEQSRDQLFKMFKRFHVRTSFGSGLGLYMIKKSAEIIGGAIVYEPRTQGSTFKLVVPFGRAI